MGQLSLGPQTADHLPLAAVDADDDQGRPAGRRLGLPPAAEETGENESEQEDETAAAPADSPLPSFYRHPPDGAAVTPFFSTRKIPVMNDVV